MFTVWRQTRWGFLLVAALLLFGVYLSVLPARTDASTALNNTGPNVATSSSGQDVYVVASRAAFWNPSIKIGLYYDHAGSETATIYNANVCGVGTSGWTSGDEYPVNGDVPAHGASPSNNYNSEGDIIIPRNAPGSNYQNGDGAGNDPSSVPSDQGTPSRITEFDISLGGSAVTTGYGYVECNTSPDSDNDTLTLTFTIPTSTQRNGQGYYYAELDASMLCEDTNTNVEHTCGSYQTETNPNNPTSSNAENHFYVGLPSNDPPSAGSPYPQSDIVGFLGGSQTQVGRGEDDELAPISQRTHTDAFNFAPACGEAGSDQTVTIGDLDDGQAQVQPWEPPPGPEGGVYVEITQDGAAMTATNSSPFPGYYSSAGNGSLFQGSAYPSQPLGYYYTNAGNGQPINLNVNIQAGDHYILYLRDIDYRNNLTVTVPYDSINVEPCVTSFTNTPNKPTVLLTPSYEDPNTVTANFSYTSVGVNAPTPTQFNEALYCDVPGETPTLVHSWPPASAPGSQFWPIDAACPIEAGVEYCATVSLFPGGGIVGDPSTYVWSNTFTGCSSPIVDEPYAQFFGADVSAGGGFGNSDCDDTANGNIYTSLDTATVSPASRGSASQFGAEALGVIEGLRSDSLASDTNDSNLSFANTGSTVPSGGTSPYNQLGGDYGVANNCVPDYAAGEPANPPPYDATTVENTTGQNAYSATGPLLIGNLSIQNGVDATIYVKGDVYINGDIEYAGSAGLWNSISDIPSLYIVASGNIYIAPGVTTLDGMYIAEPSNGSGGTINTCGTQVGGIPQAILLSDPTYYSACDNQLTVNGAFVAQNIFLDRDFSSLRYGNYGENPQGTSHSCGTVNARDCAAEIFNFSPEAYLSKPAGTPTSGPSSAIFDYITTLPPVL